MILQNTSAPTALNLVDFDPEYSVGARNAVRVCLNIQPSEKVTVITDAFTRDIAASVVHEIEAVGAQYNGFILEEIATRPLKELPAEILADMDTSDVSI